MSSFTRSGPLHRAGHTFERLNSSNDGYLVIGGYGDHGLLEEKEAHCLLDASGNDHQLPLMPGSPCPFPRVDTSMGHVISQLAHLNQIVYLFGGVTFDDDQVSILNDLWRLDVGKNGNNSRWTCVQIESPPAERSGHIFETLDSEAGVLLLHGGEQMGNYFGDSWLYSSASGKWQEVKSTTAAAVYRSPCGRIGHSSCSLGDGRALIFGGMSVSDEQGPVYMNDLWLFELSHDKTTGMWVPLDMISGIAPSPRDRAAMCRAEDGSILILGGFGYCVSSDEGAEDAEDNVTETYLHDTWKVPVAKVTGVTADGRPQTAFIDHSGSPVTPQYTQLHRADGSTCEPIGRAAGATAAVGRPHYTILLFGGYVEDEGFFGAREVVLTEAGADIERDSDNSGVEGVEMTS